MLFISHSSVVALVGECIEELLLKTEGIALLVCYRVAVSFNKKLNKDKKQLAFCSLRSPILANNFLPVN
jgi:hypothetical protein